VYRRRLGDMPAFEPEVSKALEEGVKIMELVIPTRIQKNTGDGSNSLPAYRLTLQQMKIGKEKIAGRPYAVPDGEKKKTIDVHDTIVAIGAKADNIWHFLEDESKSLDLRHCRLIEQKIPVFFGGDLTSPIKSVSDAIASGKQAAMALDTYFEKGLAAIETRLAACRVGSGPAISMDAYLGGDRQYRNIDMVNPDDIVRDYFQPAPRVNPPTLDARLSIRSFEEIGTTYEHNDAKKEAARCFNCGICNACDYCRLYCPEMAVIVENAKRRIDLDYCKGCGVCATECPRNAMALEEEIK
jgi:Pyruvate/2-oxoacid:ferredoxin oxidoreductase delta subunit